MKNQFFSSIPDDSYTCVVCTAKRPVTDESRREWIIGSAIINNVVHHYKICPDCVLRIKMLVNNEYVKT